MWLKNFDIRLLRTFLLIADGSTFSGAAGIAGRSQSAITLQIQKLERDIGARLLTRGGDGRLTATGERFAAIARGLVSLNDEAISYMRGPVSRSLRLGIAYDVAGCLVPGVISSFSQACAGASIAFRIAAANELFTAVDRGDIDLAIGIPHAMTAEDVLLVDAPMVWLGSASLSVAPGGLIPLGLCDGACPFRDAALGALGSRYPFHIPVTSSLLEGLLIPARAGLCVTVRTPYVLPPSLIDLGTTWQLPQLPNVPVMARIGRNCRFPELEALVQIIRDKLAGANNKFQLFSQTLAQCMHLD